VLFADDTDFINHHPERAGLQNVIIDDIFDKMNK
jgi:hypothetical protein